MRPDLPRARLPTKLPQPVAAPARRRKSVRRAGCVETEDVRSDLPPASLTPGWWRPTRPASVTSPASPSHQRSVRQSGDLSLVQICPDTVLSLVDSVHWTPYFAGPKVYAITTNLPESKTSFVPFLPFSVLLWHDKWPIHRKSMLEAPSAIKTQLKKC